MDIQIHCVANAAELPEEALSLMRAAQSRELNLQLGPDWFAHYECTVARPAGDQPCHWLVCEGMRVMGVIPLQQPAHWGAGGFKERLRAWCLGEPHTSLGNYYTTCWAPAWAPDAQPSHAQAWARRLRLRGWRQQLQLGPLAHPSEHAGTALLVQGLQAAGWKLHWQPMFDNHYQAVTPGPGAFDRYWAKRPGALRHTAERAQRRLAKAGGELQWTLGGAAPDQVERFIGHYQTVYARSWKAPESFEAFMPGLIRLSAHRGELRGGVALLQGKPIAVQLWWVLGRPGHCKAEIYKLAYDQEALRFSAGSLLGRELMRRVINSDGVQEVDYLSGGDAYKASWMDAKRQRWCLWARP